MVCVTLIMIMYDNGFGLRGRPMEPSSELLFTIWRRWVWSKRLRMGGLNELMVMCRGRKLTKAGQKELDLIARKI